MRPGRVVNGVLSRVGFRVVRVESGVALGEGQKPAAFFPHTEQAAGPWAVPESLAESTTPWRRVLAELYRRPASYPASIAPPAGELLHALVRNIRPRVVVETGTCHGASTIWIAAAMKEAGGGLVHTFDDFEVPDKPGLKTAALYQDRLAKVRERFERAGVADLVRIHKGNSRVEVARARGELAAAGGGGGVHLAFLDGDHTFEGVLEDFRAVEPVLAVGGYVVLHDTFPQTCRHSGPRRLMDEIEEIAEGRYQVCDLYTAPANYGLGVMRRVG